MAELRFTASIATDQLEQDGQKTRNILDSIIRQAESAGQSLDQVEAKMVEHLGNITEALGEIGREMSAFEDYQGNLLPDVDVEQYRALKEEFRQIQELRRQQTDELKGVRAEISELQEYTTAVEDAQNAQTEAVRETAQEVTAANEVTTNSNNELANAYRELSASAAQALSSIASSSSSIGTEAGSSISAVRENIQALELNLEEAQTIYDQWLENTAELPFDLSSFEQVAEPLRRIKSQLTEQREELGKLEQAQQQQANSATDAATRTAIANDIASSSIDELIAKYKDIAAEIDAEQRSLRLLEDQLKDVNREMKRTPAGNEALGNLTTRDSLEGQITQRRKEIADLTRTQEQYGQVLRSNSVDTDNLTKATVSFRTQVTQARNRLSELIDSGNASNEEIKAAEDELKRLALVQREVANRQKALTDSFSGGQLQGAIQGVQALVGSYTALRGVVSIFTSDQEKQDAIQRQLAQGLSILVGVQQVSNALNQTSAFRINTVTRLQELWARANTRVATTLNISTAAARGLMGVLTGGLAIAIPLLINWLTRLVDKQNEAYQRQVEIQQQQVQAQNQFSTSVARGVANTLAQFNLLQTRFQELTGNIQAQNKFIEDNADVFTQWGYSINSVTDAERLLIDNEDNFRNSIIARARSIAGLELLTAEYQKQIEAQFSFDNINTELDRVLSNATEASGRYSDQLYGYFTESLNRQQQEQLDIIEESSRRVQQIINGINTDEAAAVDFRDAIGLPTNEDVKAQENSLKNIYSTLERYYSDYQKRLTTITQENQRERNQLTRDSLGTEEERIQFDLDLRLRAIEEERQGVIELVNAYNELARSTGREEISADLSIFDRLVENANSTSNAQLDANAQETINKNRQYWSQYLREYGTFQERLTEITADYQNRIAEAQREGLTGQVAILQQELQTAIANLNIEGFSDTLFGDLGSQSSSAINAAIQQAQSLITLLRQGAGNNPQLLEVIERLQNAVDNAQTNVRGRLSTGLKGIATPLRQAANLASQFNDSLGTAIGYSATLVESFASISEGVENSRKAFSDFSTLMQSGTASVGDIISGIGGIGGAIGGIIGGLTSIVGLFDRSAERQAEAARRTQAYQEAANRQLERYIELLDTASGSDYWNAQSNALGQLNTRLNQYIRLFELYVNAQRPEDDQFGFTNVEEILERAQSEPGWFAQLPEFYQKIINNILELREQIDGLEGDFTERLTQTTASDLESAIRQGLRGGMSGIDDLGEYFEEVMRDSLIQSFLVDQGGRKAIQDFYDRYAQLAEDGLTDTEIEELRNLWQTIIDNAKQAAGDIDQLLGTSAKDSRTAVAQGIATASQDSVDELNGRFTAIQSHTYQMNQTTLDMLRLMNLEMVNSNAMLNHVAAIHLNTDRLAAIEDSLISIETRGIMIKD